MKLFTLDETGIKTIVSLPWDRDPALISQGTKASDRAKSYLASVWAYRCITVRANALAGIPWGILQGDSELPATDEVVRLLRNVDQDLNWSDLARATESDLLIFGTGYWHKVRPKSRRDVVSLRRLNPLTMYPVVDVAEGLKGWEQKINGVKVAEFERQEIVYFREYNPTDDLGGLAPLQVAMAAVNAGSETTKYLASFFKNYAVPPLILTTDQNVGDNVMQRMIAWWNKLFKGADNQHKTGFLGSGFKPYPVGYSTKDLALSEVMDNVRKDVCAAFGVGPALAGAWEAPNQATMRDQRESLYEEVILPRARYMAGVINAELVPEFKGERTFEFYFDELPIMQPDRESEARIHTGFVMAGLEKREAAANAMGIDDIDIPTIEEVQEYRQAVTNMGGTGGLREISTSEDTTSKASHPEDSLQGHLDKWERKALKRIKRGKPAQCEFDSDYIGPSLDGAIYGQLAEAETEDDVRRVFNNARSYHWESYP